MKFGSISCIVLSLVAVVGAVPRPFYRKGGSPTARDRASVAGLDTNAKRLAVGLPPLPARKLWNASGTKSAKRSSTSPIPHTGKVGIKAKNGTSLGYISKVLNANGQYTLDLDANNAAQLFFAARTTGNSSQLSVKDTTALDLNATFFGAVIAQTFYLIPGNVTLNDTLPGILRRDTVQQNQTDHVVIVGVAQTSPGSPPVQVPNTIQGSSNDTSQGYGTGTGGGSSGVGGGSGNNTQGFGVDGESSIWNYDPTTQQYGATWINYDGSAVDAIPYFNPGVAANVSSLALVSDEQSYLANNPEAFPIDLGFVG